MYSPNTLQEIEKNMIEHNKSSYHIKKMMNIFKNVSFEYVSTGNLQIKDNQKGSSNTPQNGQWEFDEDFKQIILTTGKAKEVYTVKELTENSFKLSFLKEGKELIQEYIPYIEKEPVKLKEKLDENVKVIDFQTFNYKKELVFGYIVKKDSTDSKCYFVRNDGDIKEALIKINGELIKLKLVNEDSNGDKKFFQEYTCKICKLRVEYEYDDTHKSTDYTRTLKSKIILTINGENYDFSDLYAESLSD
jgi:hypothetical protein